MPGASVLKTVVLEPGQEAGTAEVQDAATLLVHRQGFATHRLATLRLARPGLMGQGICICIMKDVITNKFE